MDDINQQINEEEVAAFYNKVEEIWPKNEPWYIYTKSRIADFVHKHKFKSTDYVLNVQKTEQTVTAKTAMLLQF